MTTFKLDRYDILLQADDGPAEHQVTVYAADELYAEREAPKYGLAIRVKDGEAENVMGANLRALQIWCALKRERKYDKPFANFQRTDLLAVQEAEAEPVDPTSARTDAPSSSAAATTGPPSHSGSTPTDPVGMTV